MNAPAAVDGADLERAVLLLEIRREDGPRAEALVLLAAYPSREALVAAGAGLRGRRTLLAEGGRVLEVHPLMRALERVAVGELLACWLPAHQEAVRAALLRAVARPAPVRVSAERMRCAARGCLEAAVEGGPLCRAHGEQLASVRQYAERHGVSWWDGARAFLVEFVERHGDFRGATASLRDAAVRAQARERAVTASRMPVHG